MLSGLSNRKLTGIRTIDAMIRTFLIAKTEDIVGNFSINTNDAAKLIKAKTKADIPHKLSNTKSMVNEGRIIRRIPTKPTPILKKCIIRNRLILKINKMLFICIIQTLLFANFHICLTSKLACMPLIIHSLLFSKKKVQQHSSALAPAAQSENDQHPLKLHIPFYFLCCHKTVY